MTRTGRPFFNDATTEVALLDKVRAAITQTDLWETLATDWLVLDAELLPWSAKAEELLRRQYASVGCAATATLFTEVAVLEAALGRRADVASLLGRTTARRLMATRFVDAYRHYCWPVGSLDDLRLAPFQILAGEGKVHALTDHLWHLDILSRLAEIDPSTFRTTATTVGGHDDRGPRVAGRQQLEEQVGGFGLEGDVADLVDDQQRLLARRSHRASRALKSAGDENRRPGKKLVSR